MNTSPDHPDFTALALGEHIHGTPAQAVLEALRTSVAARVEAGQIQTTARHLAFALKGLPPLRLDAARRNDVLSADPEAVLARFEAEELNAVEEVTVAPPRRHRPSWIFPTLAAAGVAAAVFVALRMLPGYVPPSQRVALPDEHPGGKIMVTPQRQQGIQVPNPGRTPAPLTVQQDPVPQPPPQSSELPAPQEPASAVVKEAPPQFPVIQVPPVDPSQYTRPLPHDGTVVEPAEPARREQGRTKRK
jgi:hypothetical protein